MDIYISENIKRLRREKNITQEKLAEHLNVSTQAVSKWERNETYPDITMILPLASYFGVSTDELLGLDAAKNEAKIQEYLDKYCKLGACGKRFEQFNLMCKAYKEFPNDFRVIEKYIWELNYDPNYTTEPFGEGVHKDELYHLCYRVLDECTIAQTRFAAASIIGNLYILDGMIDKAKESCEQFPASYYDTKSEQMEQVYARTDGKLYLQTVRENIKNIVEHLINKMRNFATFSVSDNNSKITMYEKCLALADIIYEKGDYGFTFYHLGHINCLIAQSYIEQKAYDKALEYAEKGLAYCKQYDELPILFKHTSLFVGGVEQDLSKTSSSIEENRVSWELRQLKSLMISNETSSAFNSVIEKYVPYAKAINLA